MKIFHGVSGAEDGQKAVQEAIADWKTEDTPPDLILAFGSTKQDPTQVVTALKEHFGDVPIAGCTTSGEHLNGKHYNGHLVLMGIHSPQIDWAVTMVSDLKDFDAETSQSATQSLFDQLELERESVNPNKVFSLLYIDGLSMKEEHVASLLADSLEGVPLVGGSAGDDLAFKETLIYDREGARSNAAVIVMGKTDRPFKILKHQHFKATDSGLAITKADVASRRVIEIDGRPAAQAYAAALGVERKDLTSELSFLNPLTFTCNNDIYVRSIQKIEDDDSIVFYCAIDEGIVLDICSHHEMVPALEKDLSSESTRPYELLIGANCILRALEAESRKLHEDVGSVFDKMAQHSIAFDTYGEQLNGLHINQTLVALAFPPVDDSDHAAA